MSQSNLTWFDNDVTTPQLIHVTAIKLELRLQECHIQCQTFYTNFNKHNYNSLLLSRHIIQRKSLRTSP